METLKVTSTGPVLQIQINRPMKRNAANLQTWSELHESFVKIVDDDATRCVVITGDDRSFCSGADLSEIHEKALMDESRSHELMGLVRDVVLALNNIPQPTIAAVRGVAVGAGANLAFGCDLIVAGDSAVFAELFVRRGLSVDFGGSWSLNRRVGYANAMEMALLGEHVSAARALEMGLINRLVSDEQVLPMAHQMADTIASLPITGVRLAKRAIQSGADRSLIESLEVESTLQVKAFKSPDFAEAVLAFVEKRDPNYS